MKTSPFSIDINPDWEGLVDCIRRRGRQERVHFIELFLDEEVKEAICQKYGLADNLNKDDEFFIQKREIAIQRFLGYDYVRCGLEGVDFDLNWAVAKDTAPLECEKGRDYINEHRGPITSWEEFESYSWPNPKASSSGSLEWYQENLPDDMCIIGSGGFAHFAELLNWLMGYESLCYGLYDQRDLVSAICDRLLVIYKDVLAKILMFDRVAIIWGSDDMGFRSGTLISPQDLREFVLPGHKLMARISHQAGRPYLLHSCGNLAAIMDDLIDDVGIDAKHSFEDTIEDVIDAKRQYGDRIALLGGIDIDFLCRSQEQQIRSRVRKVLEACMPGGGYCLGTGNSVANYIPVENYLVMLDEGRKFGAL